MSKKNYKWQNFYTPKVKSNYPYTFDEYCIYGWISNGATFGRSFWRVFLYVLREDYLELKFIVRLKKSNIKYFFKKLFHLSKCRYVED